MPAKQPDRVKQAAKGRPLFFLALVLSLWVGGRVVVASSLLNAGSFAAVNLPRIGPVWPAAHERSGLRLASIFPVSRVRAPDPPRDWSARIDRMPIAPPHRVWSISIDRAPVVHSMADTEVTGDAYGMGAAEPAYGAAHPETPSSGIASAVPVKNTDTSAHHRRWSGSAWVFWREKGAGAALTGAGQLGGSQAGVRLERRIAEIGKGQLPLLLYGRVTGALKAPHQPEAALGVAIKALSGRTPLSIGVERRIALDKEARNAFALLVAGGLNPTRIFGPFRAEGYAQAGMVGLSRHDLFADGRLSLAAPLDRHGRLQMGATISGGAQPHVSRLDIGPMAQARLPLGPIEPRLVVEWRQRIAGHARPGSGLSVTLASDF